MSLGSVTITYDSVAYVFDVASVSSNGQEVIRLDSTHGSLMLPQSLTQGIQTPSARKPGRFMLRSTVNRRDAITGEVSTCSAHTVLTVPAAAAITADDVEIAYGILRTFLTPEKAVELTKGVLI